MRTHLSTLAAAASALAVASMAPAQTASTPGELLIEDYVLPSASFLFTTHFGATFDPSHSGFICPDAAGIDPNVEIPFIAIHNPGRIAPGDIDGSNATSTYAGEGFFVVDTIYPVDTVLTLESYSDSEYARTDLLEITSEKYIAYGHFESGSSTSTGALTYVERTRVFSLMYSELLADYYVLDPVRIPSRNSLDADPDATGRMEAAQLGALYARPVIGDDWTTCACYSPPACCACYDLVGWCDPLSDLNVCYEARRVARISCVRKIGGTWVGAAAGTIACCAAPNPLCPLCAGSLIVGAVWFSYDCKWDVEADFSVCIYQPMGLLDRCLSKASECSSHAGYWVLNGTVRPAP